MIRISRLSDYAVLVMCTVAHSNGRLSTTQELSQLTHLGEPTVSKVLKKLVKAELLISVRGAKGGYKLAQTPKETSITDIIAAIDGPIAVTNCIEGSGHECAIESLCESRRGWQKVNHAIHSALKDVALSDFLWQGERYG